MIGMKPRTLDVNAQNPVLNLNGNGMKNKTFIFAQDAATFNDQFIYH